MPYSIPSISIKNKLMGKSTPPAHRFIVENPIINNGNKVYRVRHNKGTRMNQMANKSSVINAKNGSSITNTIKGRSNTKHLRIVQPAQIDKTALSRYLQKFASKSLAAANWSTKWTRGRVGRTGLATAKLIGEVTLGTGARIINATTGTQLKKGADNAYAYAANIASKKSKEFKQGVSNRLTSKKIAGKTYGGTSKNKLHKIH
jgi:hypothetical protein